MSKKLTISLLAIALVTFASCSPRIVERIVVQRDTTIVHHRDSIVTKDSVYIREWMKGDTVWVEKFRDRYVYKDRWRDSNSVKEVHDTTLVEKKVEKELSWAQRAKINSFWWLVAIAFVCLVWIFRKPLFAIIKKIV